MKSPEKITLADVQRRVDALPTLPEISLFVLNLLEDPKTSASDVTNVIVRDPSLSMQVLKLVNSAYYGLPQKISDLNRGVALLGFGRVKSLVLSVSMLRIFQSFTPRRREDFAKFWIHSAVVAGVTKRLTLRMGRGDPEQAFALGLLHDVGKIAMMGYFQNDYATVVATAEERKCSFADAESVRFVAGHADIGAWMARSWSLSKEMIEGIASHHTPGAWQNDALRAALMFADHAARARGVACAGSCDTPVFEDKIWDSLGLPQEDYFEMMAAVDNERSIGELIFQVSGAGEGVPAS